MTPLWPLLPVETGSWIFKKIISHEPQKVFLQSLHHLKDLSLYYISYTDMTLIWPLLPVENGRSRKQKYSEVLFRMYCVHPVRAQTAFPPHIIIVCAHIQHEAVVFNRVARRTELHVYMYPYIVSCQVAYSTMDASFVVKLEKSIFATFRLTYNFTNTLRWH